MEGQHLLSLVNGRAYNAELRAELIKAGLRRISGTQWISKETAAKYELIISDEETKIVTGVDIVEANQRIHVLNPQTIRTEEEMVNLPVVNNVHHKTANALYKQLEISDYYFTLMDEWNEEMYRGTPHGYELKALCQKPQISWEDFLFLPDPMASGEYVFATLHSGKRAEIQAWLMLPDEKFIVPTDGTPEGALQSLTNGVTFHAWEFNTFDTPAAAGQFAIKMINQSNTTYAQAIRRLLGKENGKVTRNDFYRNAQKQMCRLEVKRDERGLHFTDVPALPTIADCIDSLLAPYIKARALQEG